MVLDLSEVRLLEQAKINEKERWIYSADANDPKLERIAEELADMEQIYESGGIVIILAHEGRYGKAKPLDYVSTFLSSKTRKQVDYFSENDTPSAVDYSKGLKPGQIVVMGNTRVHQGEEENSLELASRFAGLGEKVASGGFGKAHRKNASNVGILEYLSGYLTRSQIKEMEKLGKWAGNQKEHSIAILGGVKGEKIKDGLAGFLRTYQSIIPGGIVLNTILKSNGYEIGDSVIKDKDKDFVEKVKEMLKGNNEKMIIPSRVVIARRENNSFVDSDTIDIEKGVPAGFMIVDFELTQEALLKLDSCVKNKGKIVMAGTPGIYTSGFRKATDPLLECMNQNPENSIVLGGDTAEEIKTFGMPFRGNSSSGGGSSLHYLAHGNLPLLDALRKNKKKFSE